MSWVVMACMSLVAFAGPPPAVSHQPTAATAGDGVERLYQVATAKLLHLGVSAGANPR